MDNENGIRITRDLISSLHDINFTDKILRFGYPFDNFPFIHKVNGRVRGIFLDIWTAVAKKVGRKLIVNYVEFGSMGGYEPEDNGLFGGILGEMEAGRLDVAAADYICTEGRFSAFECTMPFDNRVYRIYERRRPALDTVIEQFKHFALLDPLNLLIIATGLTLLQLMTTVQRKMHSWFGISDSWTYYMTSGVAILNVFYFTICFGALFRGNAILPTKTRPSTIGTVVSSLRAGNRSMVVLDRTFMHPSEIGEFFGTSDPNTNRFYEAPNLQVASDLLCSDATYVFLDNEQTMAQQFTREKVDMKCSIGQVDNVDYYLIPANASIRNLDIGTVFMKLHLFSRTIPGIKHKKLTEEVNQVVLRLYDWDKYSGLWFRRYTGRNQLVADTDHSADAMLRADYTPIAIDTMNILFYILLVCCGIATAVLFMELFYYYYLRKNRKITKLLSDRRFSWPMIKALGPPPPYKYV